MSDWIYDKAHADLGKRIRRMRRWDRYGPVLIIAAIVALVVAVVGVWKLREAGQFTLRMRPAVPLSMAACIREVAPHGYIAQGHVPIICVLGKGRTWYHAALTNHGGDAYPACSATGFSARGKVVYSGALFFNFGGYPAGLYAKGHRSTVFTWYIPKVSAPITRYVTSCGVNENPPI